MNDIIDIADIGLNHTIISTYLSYKNTILITFFLYLN